MWVFQSMIFEAFGAAFHNLSNPNLLLMLLAGVIIGVIVGIIPGISGMLALALILPFVFTMTPEQSMILMMAILSVQFMGGSISAILIGVPGVAASSAATVLDGFAMTQKGEGGRALGAALTASFGGKVLTVIWALAMIPLVLPMIMALRSADMVFIILLGLACIGVLASGSMIKGLLSGAIGLLISFIGFQDTTGVARFTFGSLYLYDGLPTVPVALGFFAVPEMISLATTGGTLARTQIVIKGYQDVVRGMKDVLHHKMLLLRGSVIGFIVGLIPGIGAETSVWVSYGQAKLTSKHPEEFGHGTVEGVIAPESANDAKEAGDLLTTLALGIPGGSVYALILGAFIMLGLQPGPEMMTKHLDLSLTMLITLLAASTIGALITLPLAPHLAKIAFIPGNVLCPLVLVLVSVGAYANQQSMADVFALMVMSTIGLTMKKFGYSRAGAFIGFVLGTLFERYFFISFKLAGPLFFWRPISMVLLLTLIGLICYPLIRKMFPQQKKAQR